MVAGSKNRKEVLDNDMQNRRTRDSYPLHA